MTNAIAVRPGESVSGVAWIAATGGFPELHIVGKLSFLLLADGKTSLMSRPELPGRNQGVGAAEELEPAAQRRLIVHGPRSEAGRVVLRRGPTPLAETGFQSGNEPISVALSNTMHTTMAGRRGDEWLVVEAGSAPSGRRWCKLPKLGIVAKWGDVEQLLLTSRACLVDVSTWVVAFVLRASRKLPAAMIPQGVSLSLLDLSASPEEGATNAAAYGRPTGAPAPAAPGAQRPSQVMAAVAPAEDDDADRTAIREPPRPKPALMLEDSADEPKTRLVDVALEIPREALRDPRDAPERRPSSAGLRIGRTSSPAIPAQQLPKVEPPQQVHDEPTVQPLEPLEAGPSSVTRAFAALSPDTRPPVRTDLLRRIKDGARLDDLDLRGADLAGIAIPGASLGGLDLTGADLSRADLMGTDLAGARLDRARLDGARLEGADLMCASLCGASLRGCSLAAANFAGADLAGADLSGAAPVSALAGANFGK